MKKLIKHNTVQKVDLRLAELLKIPAVKAQILPTVNEFQAVCSCNPIHATAEQIIKYYDFIKDRYKANTVNFKICQLQRLENLALEHGIIDNGMLKYLKDKKQIKSLKIEHFHELKISIWDIKHFVKTEVVPSNIRAYVELLASTGLRVSAALRIKTTDIRLVEQTRGRITEHFYLIDALEKRDKSRKIPVGIEIMESILQNAKNNNHNPHKFLFPNVNGTGNISRQGMDFQLRKYWKVIFSKSVSSHDFRHFFSEWHRDNGTSIYDLKTMLGHTDIGTTEIYYGNAFISPERFNINIHSEVIERERDLPAEIREKVAVGVANEQMELEEIDRELEELQGGFYEEDAEINKVVK